MVEWSDEAIILDNKKYNETSNIVTILSQNHGLYNSILKYAFSQSNRSIFQIGNIVQINWYAKSHGQMGNIKGEIEKNIAINIFNNHLGIFGLGSASYIIKNSLIERQQERSIYSKLYNFLVNINDQENFKINYLKLEEIIIKNAGYGLDYSKCIVTGSKENLYYLSPKTGKAISKDIGQAYAEKLFILPKFMIDPKIKSTSDDYKNGFKIMGYFIEKYILFPKNLSLPPSRQLIIETI